MSLTDQILNEMKTAMKGKEVLKLSVLRMLKSAMKYKEIELKRKLDDTDIVGIVRTMIKQREDSVAMFKKGGRDELAEKETKEIEILSVYLPEPLSKEELEALVVDAVKKVGASSPRDMGKVMKEVLLKAEGKADGKTLSQIVKNVLTNS